MSNYNGMSTSLAIIGNALLRNADNEEARKAAAERQAYQLQEQGTLKRELQEARSAEAMREAKVRQETAAAETERKKLDLPQNRNGVGLAGNLAVYGRMPMARAKNIEAYLKNPEALTPEQVADAESVIRTDAFQQYWDQVGRTGADYSALQEGVGKANINAFNEFAFKNKLPPGVQAKRVGAMKGDAQFGSNGMNLYDGGLSQGGREILASHERQSAAGGRAATSLEDKIALMNIGAGIKAEQAAWANKHKEAMAYATKTDAVGRKTFDQDAYNRAMAEPSASAPAPLLNTGRKTNTSFSAFE